MSHEQFIIRAIELAYQAKAKGNEPFGAVLVKNDVIVAEGENEIVTLNDPSAHAESLLLRTYCQTQQLNKPWLEGYTLYSNVEPCMMCCGAAHWANISRIVYSLSQQDLKAISDSDPKASATELLKSMGSNISVISGIAVEQGLKVFENYRFD